MAGWFGKRSRQEVLDPDYDDVSSFLDDKNAESETDVALGNGSICVISSDTKKSLNQDYGSHVFVDEAQAHVFAVADGVGSSFKAEESSRLVCEKAVELVARSLQEGKTDVDFCSIFETVQHELDTCVESNYDDELPTMKEGSFGSTLIVGIDYVDRFVAAYVGNGSILHIGGNFIKFPAYMSLPWNAVNLLNPHTVEVEGKEALYKLFFYKAEPKQYKPSVVEVRKTDCEPGDLFVITTDGVYSSDHEVAVKDDEGEIWMPFPKTLGMLYDTLKGYALGDNEINETTLQQVLAQYMNEIKETGAMDDDTTLGVVVTKQAIDYLTRNKKI